ncbi:oligopeptide transporter, partial [Polychaeton citri CBS 116435]
ENYIQYARHDPLHPGALGLGEGTASLILNCFLLLSYTSPVLGAVIADQHLGRYKTLVLSLSIYFLGLSISLITSIPALLDKGAGLPGVIISIIIVSLALGGIKAALPPFFAEQCKPFSPKLRVLKSGKKVIVTHEETLEYAFNVYYWGVNVGCQAMVVSTFLEKYLGFWTSFLSTLIAILIAFTLLILGHKHFVEALPCPSVAKAGQVCYIAACKGFELDAARPAQLTPQMRSTVNWDDSFIDEMQMALTASRIGIPLIFYWLSQNQLLSNTISQAGTMETHGVPNNLIADVNGIVVLIVLPLVTHVLNPALRQWKIAFTPVTRIALGFLLEVLAMGYAGVVQALVYAAPPCYNQPLDCSASDGGRLPNQVNVAVQLPIYILEGTSEVFSNPAVYEYAFTVAPKSMKSILQAIFTLTAAAGSGLGMALAPVYHNPNMVIVYSSLGGVMTICTVGTFCFLRPKSTRVQSGG